jgi:hypothetical protein
MDRMTKYRQPVISRETRLLLITIIASITALWVLARIRFQDRPTPTVAVSPVLAQLRPSVGYDELARLIAEIRPRVVAAVFASDGGLALRIRTDAGATLVPQAVSPVASDRATGLAIVRSSSSDVPDLVPWTPRLLDYPRYLVVAELAGQDVSLRPVFVGGLFPVNSPLWSGEIWSLPSGTAIPAGRYLFTTGGVFAGLSVQHHNGSAIVPGALLLQRADQLLEESGRAVGDIGVAVQSLSPAIAAAAGVRAGVVVTAVDPNGPASDELIPTDIIEAVNGQNLATVEYWRAFVARLYSGQAVTLRVRSGADVRTVELTATPPDTGARTEVASLGLRMRAVPNAGSEVLSVEPRSRADRASIRPGDILTVVGGQTAPTPAQVTRAFGALPDGGTLLVAVAGANEPRVVVLEK